MSDIAGRRVVVTGATGFIGSHLTRRLISEAAEVYVLGRYSSTVRAPRLTDVWEKLRILEANLRDLKALQNAIRDVEPEIIYHLGAYTHVGTSFSHLEESLAVNTVGTVNLLNALEGTELERFVYTGTSEIYGDNPVPFREDMKVNPVSPYAISKHAGELYCNMYYKAWGIPVVILRPFNTYGPFQSCNRIIPEVIAASLIGRDFKMTEGKQTREFNYVDDIVEGFLLAALKKCAVGEIINLGNGEEYSIREIAEKVNRLMGNRIKLLPGALKYRPVEIWRMYCDNTKARELLGWKPKTSLEEGLKKTIDWYTREFKRKNNSIFIITDYYGHY